MSKIKELKSHPNSSINLIDIIELFSPQKKSKYTELLFNMMKGTKALKDHTEEVKEHIVNNFDFITREELNCYNEIQILLVYRFLDAFFNTKDLIDFRKFCDYNERNLIEQNDLTKYKSFEDIISQLNIAELKVEAKELEGQIIKIHEDSNYIILRPLTYFASRKYGANTKWCTTQEGGEHFNRYNKKGVLIYCIGKLNGNKVAAFFSLDKNDKEFSWWDAKDARIDSMQSNLPKDIRGIIEDYISDKKLLTNHDMLSPQNRKKEETMAKNGYRDINLNYHKTALLSGNRIEAAIRRENDPPTEVQISELMSESEQEISSESDQSYSGGTAQYIRD